MQPEDRDRVILPSSQSKILKRIYILFIDQSAFSKFALHVMKGFNDKVNTQQ